MSNLEKTLSIIKPDAVERNLIQDIKNIFIKNNLKIKDSKKIQFGDGSDISEESMEVVCEIAENITYDHFWQKGDLLLVDNFLVMHGRRPFVGTRKVLASLSI